MSGCDRWSNEIDSYLDGELGERAVSDFRGHLPGCAACREAVEARRWLTDQIAALPPAEPSPQFEARFWARVAREEDADPVSGFQKLLAGLRAHWAVPVTAVAVLALWFSWSAPQRTEVGTELALSQWEILEDPDDFVLLSSDELELFALLDVLEDWDGTEEI